MTPLSILDALSEPSMQGAREARSRAFSAAKQNACRLPLRALKYFYEQERAVY